MFEFTNELAPLRRYLDKRHADTTAFRSARQVAFTAQKLGKLHIPIPSDRSEPMYPTLLRIQQELVKRHPWLKVPSKTEKEEERRRQEAPKELTRKQRRAAAKAPNWLRTGAAAKFDPAGEREFRDRKLGSFGAASEVRRIDPAAYEAERIARAQNGEK